MERSPRDRTRRPRGDLALRRAGPLPCLISNASHRSQAAAICRCVSLPLHRRAPKADHDAREPRHTNAAGDASNPRHSSNRADPDNRILRCISLIHKQKKQLAQQDSPSGAVRLINHTPIYIARCLAEYMVTIWSPVPARLRAGHNSAQPSARSRLQETQNPGLKAPLALR